MKKTVKITETDLTADAAAAMEELTATALYATLVRGSTYRLHDFVFLKGEAQIVTQEVAEHLRRHAVDFQTLPDVEPTPDDPVDPAFPRRLVVQKFKFEPAPDADAA